MSPLYKTSAVNEVSYPLLCKYWKRCK